MYYDWITWQSLQEDSHKVCQRGVSGCELQQQVSQSLLLQQSPSFTGEAKKRVSGSETGDRGGEVEAITARTKVTNQ